MEGYAWILIIVSVFILWSLISWIRETISNSKKYSELKPKLDKLEISIKEHERKVQKDKLELELKERQQLDKYSSSVQKNKEELALKEKQLEGERQQDKEERALRERQWEEKTQQSLEEVEKIAKQKSMGFPWLAEAYAEYFLLRDLQRERYLENKPHPAQKSAEIVREIKNEKKLLRIENKIISYKINYFEKLFPWLADLIAIDENDEIPVKIDDNDTMDDDSEDPVRDFLTQEEYRSLSSVERNQKALDNYLRSRNRSRWCIGRDYEMYIGYLYEQKGYSIEYKGIIDGFDDLGRDIIAIKEDEACIIQCKHWAQYREIHEKHIFQLFGTTMEYWINNYSVARRQCNLFSLNLEKNIKPKSFEEFSEFLNENKLRPIFYSSTSLSDKAKEMAAALSVEVIENYPIGDFPRIKCNINMDEFGSPTKIYHLPMDQQYDRTIITKSKGEMCVFTVKEAEDAGFRRAFKHKFKS